MAVRKKRPKKPRTKTTYTQISSKIRQLWRFSPERKARIKMADGKCEECGLEVSGWDAQVHHVIPANFRRIEDVVREEVLVGVDGLRLLCKPCHHDIHHPPKGDDNDG